MKGGLAVDPRGLIYEAYQMEIGPEEARAIFFDWAMGAREPVGRSEIETLLAAYGGAQPEHPMTAILREGLVGRSVPRRRPMSIRWRR